MKTPLDDSANESDESVLDRLSYDGSTLSVEIAFLKHEKQFNPYRMTKSQFARYKVTFTNTRAFLVIEELSAAVADLITGKDEGIIAQQVDNPDLARVLGLNVPELHGELKCISVHPSNNDIVIVYAQEEPFFESIA